VLGAFRLTPEFPIDINVGDNHGELAGIRAAVMRALMRAVRMVARPRAPFADFDAMSAGVAWLLPHAERVGAPAEFRTYAELYRQVDRQLAELDARRGRSGRP